MADDVLSPDDEVVVDEEYLDKLAVGRKPGETSRW